jgi:Hydroquinone 1,2-dioxygenase large subunit N-terminal
MGVDQDQDRDQDRERDQDQEQEQGEQGAQEQEQGAQEQEPRGDQEQGVRVGAANQAGYRGFALGEFGFARDDYFVYVDWPTGSHVLSADAFLKALQRDVAWDFFYGIVNFDGVIGTVNHYGTVDLFAGRYNDAWRKAELDHVDNFPTPLIRATFQAMLEDWTNQGFDPFASPAETGSAFGPKHGSNTPAITRHRVAAARMVGLAGDEPLRSDHSGHRVNRQFHDVAQDEPLVEAEAGFEGRVHAFNLFAYLSRSDVTWNPSVVSVCHDSLYCPTTEEYILPIIHGNDRVEWFVQLSDTIIWQVEDRDSGAVRSRVTMHPGDVAAMPADIRHQGYAPKRSMLLVWENADPQLPQLIASGQLPTNPIDL